MRHVAQMGLIGSMHWYGPYLRMLVRRALLDLVWSSLDPGLV